MEQDVAAINRNEELRLRRLNGGKLEFSSAVSAFAVTKLTFPAVYLRVTNQGKTIGIEREVVTQEQGRSDKGGKKTRETLTFEIDADYNLHLKNQDGDSLSLAEASRHLLTQTFNA